MNLRIRITVGFLIIVLVMTSVAGIIIWQESKMEQAFQHISQINEVEKIFLECRRQEKNYFLREDITSVMSFRNNYTELIEIINNVGQDRIDTRTLEYLNTLESKLDTYYQQFNKIVNSNKKSLYDANDIGVVLARDIHLIIKEISDLAKNKFDRAHAIAINFNIFSIIVGIFLSVIIAGFISTKIMDILGGTKD